MFKKSLILGGLISFQVLHAGPVAVTGLGALGANDSVNWSQLGGDGTGVGTSFSATSAGGISVAGALAGDDSLISVVCPAGTCSWAGGGFGAGDSLIWTSTADNSTRTGGNGPLTLSLGTPVLGAGLMIEADGAPDGTFTAQVVAFDAMNNILGTFTNTSDAIGDAVFLGVLDTSADIAKVTYSLIACTLQGCNNSDFAVDSLNLNAAASSTPEPSTFVLAGCLGLALLALRHRRIAALLPVAAVVAMAGSMNAQTGGLTNLNVPLPLSTLDGTPVAATLSKASRQAIVVAGPTLPLWNYTVTASKDSNQYSVTLVGQSPFNRGARTVKVPVVIIPLELSFTFTGGNVNYDPTAADDGCLGAGNTAAALTSASPLFNNAPFVFGGTNVGTTQYIDAFRRSEFWANVTASGGAYHTMLSPVTVAPVQVMSFPGTFAAGAHSATVHFGGQCGVNPFVLGSTNPGGGAGLVDINILDPMLQAVIANLGITADQFPFFVMYNSFITDGVVTTDGSHLANCCILGYHSAEGFTVSAPGQTYGIADFEGRFNTLFGSTGDISAMSHEVAEWMDDPSAANPTPPWGNIGQVGGCQNNLEVGDPLSGTLRPVVALGGFNYHVQELAFFNWYFGGPSLGVNGWFSDNGTFTGSSQPCPPGGTF